mgnify:CR=1 FL=1
MESTGEVFRSYEAFLQKKELYGQAVFSCRYSGKGSLTLEEALAAEKKAVEGLAPVRRALGGGNVLQGGSAEALP